jgi:predicted nucleic acid-binding protein
MKVFIDTDVILDFLYEREEHFKNSVIIMTLLEKELFKGYISSLIIWNLFYILSKYIGEKEARRKIRSFRTIINIIPIDGKIIDVALDSNIKDFEDSIQYFAAKNEGVDIIVTRNKKDYPRGSVSIMSPTEFIKSLAPNK